MHKQPAPKAVIVAWTDISREQTRKLEGCNDPESINEFFIKVFGFERKTKRTTILCDLFYYALQFARNNQFNDEQTSAFLSILKRVHDLSNRTSYANMEQTYQYFKALILKHSLFRPPHSLRIFTPDLTKKITDYVIDTYFRHIKMYKYIFTPYIDFSLNFTFDGMTEKEEDKPPVAESAEGDNPEADKEEKQETEENPDIVEVRKLIQAYMTEELRKIENPTEEKTEKQRRIKSSSSRSSKTRTPK